MITAEELLKQRVEEKGINYDNWIKQVPPIVFAFAIEFAELHVRNALIEASKVLTVDSDGDYLEHPTKNSILHSYPLENIK
jgi:hypothetical protein